MKNSSDTIGNRNRDIPACRTVTQPAAPPVPVSKGSSYFISRAEQCSSRTVHNPEDEGIKIFRNIGNLLPINTASSSEDLGIQEHFCENEPQTS
jgi:hypothetical protein